MSSLNTRTRSASRYTHEGARASNINTAEQLIRTVMACMLWEDGFYEDGKQIGERIAELVHAVKLEQAAAIALEARNSMKLRHVPLLIVREMARHPQLHKNPRIVSETLEAVIQRADELSEFVAIYWKDGKQPLSKQVKLGLAKAFQKFDEYALAKYNRKKDIMLRDVLFLCHSKPADVNNGVWNKAARKAYGEAPQGSAAQKRILMQAGRYPNLFSEGELLYGKLIYNQLKVPDTWEVELSAGKNKRETFTRLMIENKLGDLAFLRNLRNMVQAGVQRDVIINYGNNRKWGRVLPFRFIAAARMVPQFKPLLERWMFKCLEHAERMTGRTALLIDVSGSMSSRISSKSDLNRLDAAKALAILLREICEDVDIFTFDTLTAQVPSRRGFALADAIGRPRGGTDHRQAVNFVRANGRYDRTIILTDEQSMTELPRARDEKSYIINVASYQNGIGYGSWLHINGWSEAIIDYIQAWENQA